MTKPKKASACERAMARLMALAKMNYGNRTKQKAYLTAIRIIEEEARDAKRA